MNGNSKSWILPAILGLIACVFIFAAIFPMFTKARRAAQRATMPASPMLYKTANRTRVSGPNEPAQDSAGGSAGEWGAVYAADAARMVIKNASVSLETSNAESAQSKISESTRKAGGFVESSSTSNDDGQKTVSVTIRVPTDNYASLLKEICGMGKVTSKEEKGEDVTEEYVDIQSRLRNLNREEDQFLQVMKKANRVTDILSVEGELARVRGEIEKATGRIKYLQNQISLSTINVVISEPAPIVANVVKWDIGRTTSGALNALTAVFRWLTSVVIWLLVFIPLWLLIWLIIRGIKLLRRKPTT